MDERLQDKRYEVPDLLNRTFEFNDECKFVFVGDMHLNASTPKSRIDDYPSTMMDKLELLRNYLIVANVKYMICAGDVFHKAKQPSDFEYRVAQEFLRFKESGIRVFSIFGNHDQQWDRLDTYDKTSLGLMFLTGVIEPFSRITFNGSRKVNIYGCHFPNDIPDIADFDSYNIVVAHKFYDYNLDKDSLYQEDLEKNSFSMYCLGHDHVPYETKAIQTKSGVIRVVRPGSFSRGTAHSYNNSRMVYVDLISVGSKVEVNRVTLAVKKPEEIFSAGVLDRINIKDTSNKLSQQLSNLVSKLYEMGDNVNSIYTILDSTEMNSDVKTRIETYLYNAGIFRDKK